VAAQPSSGQVVRQDNPSNYATRKWYVLMLLSTIALWSLSYLTRSSHDGSLQVLSSVATMGAMMCSFILVAVIYLSVTGRAESRGRMPTSASSTIRRCFPVPNYGRNASDSKGGANQAVDEPIQCHLRVQAQLWHCSVTVQSRVYSDIVTYSLLGVVLALSVRSLSLSIYCTLGPIAPADRQTLRSCRNDDTAALVIVPCLAIALRLMNAPLGLLLPPQTKMEL